MPEYLDTNQAAARAHVTRRTIRKWIKNGWINASKPTRKLILIDAAELAAFLATGRKDGAA